MKLYYFEACDFNEYPVGGTLSFAKQFIKSLNIDIRLIGLVNKNEPIGKWLCLSPI